MKVEMQGRMRGGSNRYHLRPLIKLSSTSVVPKRVNNKKSSEQASSKKKKKTDVCSERSPWAYLPDDLLHIIINYLTIAGFLNLGKVCQNWRNFFHANKQNYMESQPPLVLCVPSSERGSCYLCDIFTPIRYEIKLPYFANNYCRGISNGYLITQDVDNNILLINPITGNLIKFPPMPLPNNIMHINDQAIVASIESSPEHVLIVLSHMHSDLHFCVSRDNRWRQAYVSTKPFSIRDIVVYKGRIYFMTREFELGVLNLRSGYLTLLNLYFTPALSTNARFVCSSDRMLVVDFKPLHGFKLYKMDFPSREWIELENLGDDSLFYGYKMCLKLSKTSKWGGRSNCLYQVPFFSKVCCVYSWNGGTRKRLPISEGNVFPNGNYWYFPHQSYSMDVVRED